MVGSLAMLLDYPVEEALDLFHDVGFTGVEILKMQMKQCKTDTLRSGFVKAVNALGMEIAGLNAVTQSYFEPFGTDEQLQATLEALKSDLEFAALLGAPYLLVWEGKRPEGAADRDCMERCLPRIIELYREALPLAAERNVRMLLEVHPFTLGINDHFLIKLCDALDSRFFGTAYDCCHYGIGRPRDYVDAIRALGPRIGLIHYSDCDLVSPEVHYAPGTGSLDLQAILRALKEFRFDGPLMLDLYLNPTPLYCARECMAHLRQACEYLGLQD